MFALGLGQYRPAFDRLVFADLAEDFLAVFLTVFFDVALAFADLDFDALALVALALVAVALVALDFLAPPFAALAIVFAAFLTGPWKSPCHRLFCFFCSRFDSRLSEDSGGLSR